MKRSMLLALAASVALAAPAWAKSPIDGTWKADVKSTQLQEKPDGYELKDGMYHCRTCLPAPYSVRADGRYHAVTGQAYFDELAVKVVDDRTVTTMRRKGGKPAGESTVAISEDGKMATFTWNNPAPDGSALTGKGWQKRLSAAPAGAHAISGSWMTTGYDNVSDNVITTTFRLDGEMLHMSTPGGESYAARLGGEPVALVGDPGGTMIKVRRLSDTSFEEENWRGGKLVGVATMTVGADGKTMDAVYENKLRGTKMMYKANKQ